MTADKAGNLFRRVVAKEMLEGKHTQQHDPQRWGYMVWNDATDTVRYTRYRYALGKRRATRARPDNAASRDAATAC